MSKFEKQFYFSVSDRRHNAIKRKYALAALVGALVLPLCSYGGSAETLEKKAYEYLASRYSAEFTIISAEREPDVVEPIPSFRSSYHWVLTVVSDHFPVDTFELRYGRYGSGGGLRPYRVKKPPYFQGRLSA